MVTLFSTQQEIRRGDKKVYRLYNKVDGRHHYTPKVKEKEKLVGLGWIDEGVAWETLE